jgi:hypothetical protein
MRQLARLLPLVVLILAPALLAATELRGLLTGPAGEPIAGATVVVSAQARAFRTSTSAGGSFVLQLPADVLAPVGLHVAAPGFAELELEVGDLTRGLEIQLAPAPLFSDQVEVTALRGRSGETPVTLSNLTRADIERDYWGQDVAMLLSQVPGFYS